MQCPRSGRKAEVANGAPRTATELLFGETNFFRLSRGTRSGEYDAGRSIEPLLDEIGMSGVMVLNEIYQSLRVGARLIEKRDAGKTDVSFIREIPTGGTDQSINGLFSNIRVRECCS